MSKQGNEALGWYADKVKGWPVKQVGAMPSGELLANVHALGCRPGKQALAIAMALRPQGVTGSQIVIACGAPQLNKMRGLISDGMLKRMPVPPQGETGHTVYKVTLTDKAVKAIKAKPAPEAKAAKPDKAKATKAVSAALKPRKPKAKPAPVADTAAADTAAVNATAAAEIAAAADKAGE